MSEDATKDRTPLVKRITRWLSSDAAFVISFVWLAAEIPALKRYVVGTPLIFVELAALIIWIVNILWPVSIEDLDADKEGDTTNEQRGDRNA
jgi:hypothetical protein